MLVPKSGKAEGMKRPPYTSPTPPISLLSLPWHHQTPVTINIMTLWSNVMHIYCVCLTTNLMILSTLYDFLTLFYVNVRHCVVYCGSLVWSLCPVSYFQLKTVLLCSLLVENSLLCLLLCLTVVNVSLTPGSLWVSHKGGALHHFGFCVENSLIELPGTWTDISVGNSYCLHQFSVVKLPQIMDSAELISLWENTCERHVHFIQKCTFTHIKTVLMVKVL